MSGPYTLTDVESETTKRYSTAREPGSSSNVAVEIAALSHKGLVRPNNEDSFLVNRLERRMKTLVTNLPPNQISEDYAEIAYGLIVADGMGGAAAGEVASRTALTTLVDLVIETPDWIMRLDNERTTKILSRTNERIRKLSDALTRAAKINPQLSGMGTTLTLAVTLGPDLLLAHVGDSRAYLFTKGQLIRLTRDQTMAQLLADLGLISPEELATHHQRHVLTSAITASGSDMEVELRHLHLASGDQLLLCTDGLNDMVKDEEIHAVLTADKPAEESCQALINGALAAGGKDNITVILAKYQIP